MPQQSASLTTKTCVWLVIGSSQAVAPDTTGTFDSGLMDLLQAHASTCLVVHSRIMSVSLADSVPGLGRDVEDEFEFVNQVDEWTALIPGHSL